MVVVKQRDFILGYIFGQIEKTILQSFIKKDKEIHTSVCVPKAWFGLKPTKAITETLSYSTKIDYKKELCDILNGYNTKDRWYKYDSTVRAIDQYIEFAFHGYYQEPVKEMTIAEIEKELGYKIKVIGDKEETAHYEVYCPHRINGCCTICENRRCDSPRNNCKGFAFKKP